MGGPGGGGPPGEAAAGGGGPRGVVVATAVARAEVGGGDPPSENAVKMFELAQLNLFTPEVTRGGGGGASHWQFSAMCSQALGLGGMVFAGRTSTWTPTRSAIMEMGGFDPSAANRGAYAGLVHGVASRPKPKPKVPATPTTGGPRQSHPPNPPDAFAKALGAISSALDRQGTVC